MLHHLVAFLSSILLIALISGGSAQANRLYGNVNFSFQHSTQSNGVRAVNDLSQQTLILNYEDALFTKNLMRLATNMYRREYSSSKYSEFRPIFYLDLKSYGYSISSSYSPYRQIAAGSNQQTVSSIYYRDWRNTVSLNYEKLPGLSFVYNRNRVFDRGNTRRYGSTNRNMIVESDYRVRGVALRLNYNNLNQKGDLPGSVDSRTRSFTGTAGLSQTIPRVGFWSSSYSYYRTQNRRQVSSGDLKTESGTHSVNTLFSSSPFHKVGFNLSYSGRYFRSDQQGISTSSKNENFSGQASYTPADYLSFDAIKAYQVGNESGRNQIVEYLIISSNVTRFFRQGVDSRLNVSRTIFQQSNRQTIVAGAVTGSGRYTLDIYYASVGFSPYNYVKTLLDMSVSRDSDPPLASQRYQVTRSVNGNIVPSGKLEGRFNATAVYQGSALRFGSSYSQSYNLGIAYYPEHNINVNLTYVYTSTSTVMRNNSGSLTGYLSYSFRRAFSLYASVNRQVQKTENIPGQPQQVQAVTLKPRTVNGQIVIYLTRKTTLTVGYLYNKLTSPTALSTTSESVQAVLNIQV